MIRSIELNLEAENETMTSGPVVGDAEMIRQNSTRRFTGDKLEARRMFSKILDAAEHFMVVFDPDYENHTARGLLRTGRAAHTAVLAFDASKSTLVVVVDLRTRIELTTAHVMILLRLQNRAANGSSTIHLDPESSTVQVKAHALLPAPSVVQPVVTATLRDAVRVLENDDFKTFVN
jgi:hypothetical protein